MQRKPISWILKFTSTLPNDEEKVKCLRANNHPAILEILKFCFHPNIRWLLPEGEPPYTPKNEENAENILYSEAKRLYIFADGGSPNLKQARREELFLNLIQAVTSEDAKLLISIKDKIMPYPGLTENVVRTAFPDIFNNG